MKNTLISLILVTGTTLATAQGIKPKDAGDIAKSVYSTCSLHLQTNEMQGINRYNEGKRGKDLIEGQTNCVPESKEKIIEMHKDLKKSAKSADQKKAVDDWRIEWTAAMERLSINHLSSVSPEALRANEVLQMAFE